MKIAVVGYGFVGKAVAYGFRDNDPIIIDPILFHNSIRDLAGEHNLLASFVCVPTPSNEDGTVNASIVTSVTKELLERTSGLVVIKSTVTPDHIRELSNLSSRVIYNPEFLREATAFEDFENPEFHVFGITDPMNGRKLKDIYDKYSTCKSCPITYCTPEEASFIKYGINSFLMSKVVWMNQFYDLITSFGVDYDNVAMGMKNDSRVGKSHMQVPGPDKRRGTSGPCFGKDVPALIFFARQQGSSLTILEEIQRRNQEYRNSHGEPLPREKEQHIRFDYDL